jgi:NAD(P)-dependent dehydrogenase (short-subunit alcohol dehydrogenase family)
VSERAHAVPAEAGPLDPLVRDKTMLITGASRGIGSGLADFFARRQARLILTARSEPDLARVAERARAHTADVTTIAGDITDEGFVEELFDRVARQYGQLDVLVNNAGMYFFADVEVLRADDLQQCLELNVVAPYRCLQHAVRLMKQTTGVGKIINIGSVRSHWTENGDGGAYNASKFGLHGMVETIARQLHRERSRIAVGMVCPGWVQMEGGQGDDEGKIPQYVIGQAVLHAIAAPPWVNILDTVVVPMEQSPW